MSEMFEPTATATALAMSEISDAVIATLTLPMADFKSL
jgi:hypothetical protein